MTTFPRWRVPEEDEAEEVQRVLPGSADERRTPRFERRHGRIDRLPQLTHERKQCLHPSVP